MKKRELFNIASKYRKKGYSYEWISKRLHISKSTSFLWLKDIVLDEKAFLNNKIHRESGREKAKVAVKKRIFKQKKEIEKNNSLLLSKIKFTKDLNKLICAILYWSEGEKNYNRIAFTNSDPAMIKLFLKFFSSFDIDKNKIKAILHLHSYHDTQTQLLYWSKITGISINKISIYKKSNSGKNIRKNYQGCISIRYNSVKTYKEIECLYKKLG